MDFKEYQEKAHETAIYPDICELFVGMIEKNGGKVELYFEKEKQEQELIELAQKLSNYYYPVLGLAGEVGELANKVKKISRDNGGIPPEDKILEIKKEIGDIFWYVFEVATVFGFDANEIAVDNLKKLKARKEKGTLQGSGDNR